MEKILFGNIKKSLKNKSPIKKIDGWDGFVWKIHGKGKWADGKLDNYDGKAINNDNNNNNHAIINNNDNINKWR